MRAAQKREIRLNYLDAQSVKPSAIAAKIVRNHTGARIGSCANLSYL